MAKAASESRNDLGICRLDEGRRGRDPLLCMRASLLPTPPQDKSDPAVTRLTWRSRGRAGYHNSARRRNRQLAGRTLNFGASHAPR
jgi:hypothetical protein